MGTLRPNASGRRLLAEINVVPYIDVMLVLVVILMVAAPFVNPSIVNLPSVTKAQKAPDVVVEVVVHANGSMSLRKGKSLLAIDMKNLVAVVGQAQKEHEGAPVVIAADKLVTYEHVIAVLKALQDAGVPRVGLSLKVEK